MKMVSYTAIAAGAIAIGVAVAGCGSGSSAAPASGTGSSASSASSGRSSYGYGGPAKSSAAVSLRVAGSPLGKILVDGEGKTLYLFEADRGAMSNCSGGCTAVWPPVTASGTPSAAMGAAAGLVGSTKRADGTTQVTYGGHPLYWYAGDTQAGQTAGEGLTDFGGAWYAVSAAGKAVAKPAS
jgi:predicted lipoprotein with Yx(FWY)xxD motif